MKGQSLNVGVSWNDVNVWVREFEKRKRVHVTFSIKTQQEALGRPMGLLIILEVTGSIESGRRGFTRVHKASWPTYTHKTMTGLFLYLLHSIEESLEYDKPRHQLQRKAPVYPQG